jgi:hypothetical protein
MADLVGPKAPASSGGGTVALLIVSWLGVGVPLAWGVMETLRTSMALWR